MHDTTRPAGQIRPGLGGSVPTRATCCSWALRSEQSRVRKNEPPKWPLLHRGGSFDISAAKADGRPTFRPRPFTKYPSHGEGVLVRSGYSSRPTNQCKGRSDPITENPSDAPPTRRFGPLATDERARRLAGLRTALSGAAPAFQARIDAGEREERP
jgi:hypothetical protein